MKPLRIMPKTGPIRFALGSDVEIGEALLASLRSGDVDPVATHGSIYVYESGRGLWRPFDRSELERAVHVFDGSPVNSSGGEKKRTLKLSQGRICGAIACAYATAEDANFFAEARPGIAFAGGFIEVTPTSIVSLAHLPEHRATIAMPFPYDASAPRRRFDAFLAETFACDPDGTDKIALIQEFAGACLLGLATRYQRCLVLFGTGDEGKSKLIDIIAAMFPPSAVTAIPPQNFSNHYSRALLRLARLNVVSELPEHDILESEAFKAVVTGDQIEARQIREACFTYRPQAGHIYAANRLPGTTDQTEGFWRRFVVVTFNRKVPGAQRDPRLAEKIIEAELPGVVAWAIAGAQRLLQNGTYTIPASSGAARDAWKQQADQVRLFAEDERLRPSTSIEIQGQTIYETYKGWASRNGHKALASNKFAERLELIGFTKRHTKRGNVWGAEFAAADEVTP